MENYDIRLDRSRLYVVFWLSYAVAEFDTLKAKVAA